MEGEQGATGGKASPTSSESPPSTPVNGVSDQESQDAKVFSATVHTVFSTT